MYGPFIIPTPDTWAALGFAPGRVWVTAYLLAQLLHHFTFAQSQRAFNSRLAGNSEVIHMDKKAPFVGVRVSIRAAAPTDAELCEEAGGFPNGCRAKRAFGYVPNAREFPAERYV